MTHRWTPLLLLAIHITFSIAANILSLVPVPSYSHHMPALTLTRALAARGHNLTVITPYPSKIPLKNHREINTEFLISERVKMELNKRTGVNFQNRLYGVTNLMKIWDRITVYGEILYDSSTIQDLIRELNGTKFDLILYEPFFITSFLGFADIVGNPPLIAIWSTHFVPYIDYSAGNPINPSYIPSVVLPLDDHMTYVERIKNFIHEIFMFCMRRYVILPKQQELMHKNFGNAHRDVLDLERSTSLYITVSDLAVFYPKPQQPNTISVGPLHITKPEPLPKDIQKWMDDSTDGVIYFSLGSNMKGTSVSEETRAIFIKVFKQFPKLRVLWKWESDEQLPGKPDNVLTKKWLPQQSILAHQKVRLFISQVGIQSLAESLYYGVPILGIPMFTDQDANAHKVMTAGAGLKMELKDITYDLMYDNLKEILTNKSYKENAMRLSSITRDRPMTSLDTAIWWVEYVLRHKGAHHLRPAVLDLYFYQYLMLDILAFVILILTVSFAIPYFIIKRLYKSLFRSDSKVMSIKGKKEN